MRHQYWSKYVLRYRSIREWLNGPEPPATISVYDLTSHYGEPAAPLRRFRESFFKIEPTVVYFLLGVAAWAVSFIVPPGDSH